MLTSHRIHWPTRRWTVSVPDQKARSVPTTGSARGGPSQGQHVWEEGGPIPLWGQSHGHHDKQKNSRHRNSTLPHSKQPEETGKPFVLLCLLVIPSGCGQHLDVMIEHRFWGCHLRTCHHLKPVSGSGSYFSNKLHYFALNWSLKCFTLICFNHPQMHLVLIICQNGKKPLS